VTVTLLVKTEFKAREPIPSFTKEPLPEMTLAELPVNTVNVPLEATATVPPLRVPMDEAVAPVNAKFPPLTRSSVATSPNVNKPPLTRFALAAPVTVTEPPLKVPAARAAAETMPPLTFACREPVTATEPPEMLPVLIRASPPKVVIPSPKRLPKVTVPPLKAATPELLTIP